MKAIQSLMIMCVLGCQLQAHVSFVLSSSPGVGSGPDPVAAADVNGDGKLDLICGNYYGSSLSVLTNVGSGGFVLAGTYPVGSLPRSLVAVDVNADGMVDLICANSHSGDSTLSVLTNNGSGGFALSGTYHVGIGPLSVTAADVNGDGTVDLITANCGSAGEGNTLTILTNNGSGGFALASSPVAGQGPTSVTAADVNGDGKLDLICANYYENTLSVLTNDGSGGFVLAGTYPVDNQPEWVTTADVNGDGKVDLITANFGSGGGNTLTVLTNNGSGGFGLASTLVVGNGPFSVTAADVNGDGWVDLISANDTDSTLSVLTNNGSGGFGLDTNLNVGKAPDQVTAADVNGDGKVDLICADAGDNTLSVLTNATSFPNTPPIIVAQPSGITISVGATATFSVNATGAQPLTYQWQLGGTNIANATNAMLSLSNVQLSQAGDYSVLVTNILGSTNSIAATLTVNTPVCLPPPSGLVSWWQAEGNANDSIGTNNDGVLEGGLGFAPGEVGQAFFFNNTNDDVKIPASSSLNVGGGNGFTLEAWVYCTDVTQQNPIFEWNKADGTTYWGVHFYVGAGGPGILYANIVDSGGGWHNFWSPSGVVASNVFQHVALTYDKATGTATIYRNGAIVAQSVVGSFIPQTTYDLYLGKRPGPETLHSFAGLLDEPSIYNRALSSNEIAAIYNAGSAGKCFTPVAPAITTQPTNQTVLAGGTANFSVTASGTGPLSYQWCVNGTNIVVGATNSTLTLTSVQLSQNGYSYSVLVTNLYGSTNSVAATLTVNTPVCVQPPSGLVAWWQAEGNADDVTGGDNGTLEGGASFAPGMVGQGFRFDGTNGYVQIPDSNALKPANVTVEAWVWLDPSLPSGRGGEQIVFKKNTWSAWFEGYALDKETIDNGDGTHSDRFQFCISRYGNQVAINSQTIAQRGIWYHVAATYDGNQSVLYVNGVAEASATPGFALDYDTTPIFIGTTGTWQPYLNMFGGIIDEASIYNRALSSNEIAAIYNAGSAGKCFTPVAPAITTQPANQTVLAGGMANFSVTASGTEPLSYQWCVNGTNIVVGATNSTLMLNNVQLIQTGNYSVQISNSVGSTNSIAAALTVVLPPAITQQPQSQSVASYNSASFTVAATGTGPLSYQWRKGGTNLVDGGNVSGSTTTNLNLASIGLNDAGNYDVVVSNPYATTNSAVAVLTVPQTTFTVVSTNAMSGVTVMVPVLMNAVGEENAFQASVGYDPTKLVLQSIQPGPASAGAYFQEVDGPANSGYAGFVILLNTGSTQPAGNNEEVADLVFSTLPVTNNVTVNLTFGDNPMGRQVVDNNGDPLPAVYQNGTVALMPGEYAADVSPRPTGNYQVDLSDWVEIGKMVAGLDTPTNSDEMLRADCAPRNAPDGVLTVADWVQAGRYESKLDPWTVVATPPTPGIAAKKKLKPTPLDGVNQTRTLQIGSIAAQRGQTVSVPVQLVCITNENAVGLTVSFDTNQLKLTGITMGSAMITGSKTNINYNRPGRLGMVVAMPPGKSLAAGTNQVLVLQFTTSANASGQTALLLDDSVVIRQVADKTANALAANYVNGAVMLPPQPTLTTAMTGANLQLTWPVSTGTFQVQSADSPLGPWTNATLTITTNGANATVTVTATNQQQYFRLVGQ